jgi:hypothetical protein
VLLNALFNMLIIDMSPRVSRAAFLELPPQRSALAEHPDVRRMLLTMRSSAIDGARTTTDER